jgi:conflict system STAND superfamily ATPase
VVVGLRVDFYAMALRYPQLLAAVQVGQLVVGPMNETELRAAIVEPARKVMYISGMGWLICCSAK